VGGTSGSRFGSVAGAVWSGPVLIGRLPAPSGAGPPDGVPRVVDAGNATRGGVPLLVAVRCGRVGVSVQAASRAAAERPARSPDILRVPMGFAVVFMALSSPGENPVRVAGLPAIERPACHHHGHRQTLAAQGVL